jgi:large subunit ribosomal protein L6
MSKIGRMPIKIPSGVEVTIEGNRVKVKGPKGELERILSERMIIERENDTITVKPRGTTKQDRSLHGLTRTLIANMVIGVTQGFEKVLDMVGVGYRGEVKGKELRLQLGFSHDVVYPIPDGITITTPAPTRVVVSGIDKERVGQVAAEIRAFRPPEPYKGKGIRYQNEYVRRKAGKAGK